jgi:hypothetical protein
MVVYQPKNVPVKNIITKVTGFSNITRSIEQGFLEDSSLSHGQYNPTFSWELKIHCYWTISWASWIQSTPSNLTSVRPILNLPSYLPVTFSSFPFLYQNICVFFIVSMRAISPAKSIRFDHLNGMRLRVKAMKLRIMYFPPQYSYFLTLRFPSFPCHPLHIHSQLMLFAQLQGPSFTPI